MGPKSGAFSSHFSVKGTADGGKELLISSKSEYRKSAHLQMGEKN
jgi:hypothetical protein